MSRVEKFDALLAVGHLVKKTPKKVLHLLMETAEAMRDDVAEQALEFVCELDRLANVLRHGAGPDADR